MTTETTSHHPPFGQRTDTLRACGRAMAKIIVATIESPFEGDPAKGDQIVATRANLTLALSFAHAELTSKYSQAADEITAVLQSFQQP